MFRRIAIVVLTLLIASLAFASVSFAQEGTTTPTATAQATTTPTATAQATTTAQGTTTAQTPATDPGSAGPVPSGGQTLAVGAEHWYRFQQSGDNSEIQIRLDANPNDSANFSVWTEQNLRNWQQGGAEQPIGGGSMNADMNDDMFWSGSFNSAGPIYVRVKQQGAVPANYTLSVKGSSVSSGQPSQASQTQAAETPAAQAQAGQQAQAGSPQTLPVTGGDPTLLVAALGALSLAAGAGLRRLGRR